MTLRSVLLICSFSYFSNYLQAQALEQSPDDVISPFRVGMNVGFSFAFGNFSEDDGKVETSAFAKKRGSSLQLIELIYTIKPKLKAKAFYHKAKHDIENGIMADEFSNADFDYEVNTTSYESNSVAFGLGFSIPGNTSSFDLFFLAAVGNMFAPSFDITETDLNNGDIRQLQFDSQSKTSFGVGINPELSIHLNSRLDFTSQLAFLVFEKKFESVKINGTLSDNNMNYGYEAFNLNFGLSYRL